MQTKSNTLIKNHYKNKTENLLKNKIKKEDLYLQNALKINGSIDTNAIEPSTGAIKTTKNNIENIFSSDEARNKAIKYIIKSHRNDANSNPLYYKLNKQQSYFYTLDKDSDIGSLKDEIIAVNPKLLKNNSNSSKLNIDKRQKTYTKIEYHPMNNDQIKINKKQNINFKKKSLKIENPVELTDINDLYQDQQSATSRDKYNKTLNNTDYYNIMNDFSGQKNKKNNNFEYIKKSEDRLITDLQPKLYVNSTNVLKTETYTINKSETSTNYFPKVLKPKRINKKSSANYINNKKFLNVTNSNNIYIHKNAMSNCSPDFFELNDMNLTHIENFHTNNDDIFVYPTLTENNSTLENMENIKKPAVHKQKRRSKNKIRIINNNKAIKIFNISFNDELIDRDEEEIMNQKQIEQQLRHNKIKNKKEENKKNEVNHSLINNFVNSRKFNNNVKNLNNKDILKYKSLNISKEKDTNKRNIEKILFKKKLVKEISKDCIDNKQKKIKNKINNVKQSINNDNNKNIHEFIIIQKNKNDVNEIKITNYENLNDINKKLKENNFKVDNKQVVLCTVDEINEKQRLINEITALRQKNNDLKYYLLTDKMNDNMYLEMQRQLTFMIAKSNVKKMERVVEDIDEYDEENGK